MSLSLRHVAVCAGLGVLISTSAMARSSATPPLDLSVTPVGVGATFIDINLAGWESWGGFGSLRNSRVDFNVGAGTRVTGYSFSGLTYTTSGGSFMSELTLSVNATGGDPAVDFMDWSPNTVNLPGTAGPLTGTWGGAVGGAGPFGQGSAFTAADGRIFITVYEVFDDPFGDNGSVLDATVSAGTLRVFLAPIPEPGTYGMMALGLLAIGAAMRKRQQAR